MKKIPLSESITNPSGVSYLQDAIKRNEISTYGKNLELFQNKLKTYLSNQREIVLLNSGTAAIHLALIQLGVKQGDEVLCQSFTFAASAFPIIYQGALPIFVDSEEDTWNMCPNLLEEAIKDRILKGKKPKAIIVVHSYGMPAKMDKITTFSQEYNIPIIEDAAESLGSSYKSQRCGTFGEFGVISFNGNKIITTSGGGALVCRNETQRNKSIFLTNQAKDTAPHYEHSEVGYNYAMSNLNAALGRAQMEVLDEHIAKRRAINIFYKSIFNAVEWVTVLNEPNPDFFSNHWLSCVVVDKGVAGFSHDDLREALLNENIESRPLWKPMHLQPVFADCPYYGKGISDYLFNNGLCLPSGSSLTENDLNRIAAVIKKFLGKK